MCCNIEGVVPTSGGGGLDHHPNVTQHWGSWLVVWDLLTLFVGQRLCINFSISRANFLTTLRSHLDITCSCYFGSSLANVDVHYSYIYLVNYSCSYCISDTRDQYRVNGLTFTPVYIIRALSFLFFLNHSCSLKRIEKIYLTKVNLAVVNYWLCL